MRLFLFYTCLLLCVSVPAARALAQSTDRQDTLPPVPATSFNTSSVLSEGNWFKIGVTETGIHKIDKAVLQALGIPVQQLDPRTLQVFGNGGGMLPQANNIPRHDDLVENALWVEGEADGRFNDADYALFYAQGPHTWHYTAGSPAFRHQHNIYSDTAYYFIRVGSTRGLRVGENGPSAETGPIVSTYNERLYHERELKNIVNSGREWYGEDFSAFNLSRTVGFPVSDIAPGSTVQVVASLMANSSAESSYTLRLNQHTLGTQAIDRRTTSLYHPEGVNSLAAYTLQQQTLGQPASLTVALTYNTGSNPAAMGFLNYLELHYERQLKLYADQTVFRSVTSLSTPFSTFQLADAPAGTLVWDVTQPHRPIQQHTSVSGNTMRFTAPTNVLREFVAFRKDKGLKPHAISKVTNQNLHAHNQHGRLDLVILTHPRFLKEAHRLAAHRRQHSAMEVEVVTTTQVYNEFSSGAQDVTAIRDYMRMVYQRSNKQKGDALYLLLFGDASYDYKNRVLNNTNLVPTYQSRQSLHPINSYASDDYFGFLHEDEGEWEESNAGNHLLALGIGRLPAKTAQEATTLVNKIIAYDSPAQFGKWRKQITFVADDGDFNEHLNDAEFLAAYLEQTQVAYNPNKVFLDLYPQQMIVNGQRSPQAAAAVDKAVEQGSLIVNYTGHGNETSWAWEQILTTQQIGDWRNKDRLTFLLTATCEFGRHDDPRRASGAELALLHPQGGAVGLLTTTRPVFSSDNRVLNRNFFSTAFEPINGRMPRLGDLVRLTKNKSLSSNQGASGLNNRNFTLLGDPSQQLAYPTKEAQLTRINGQQPGADTLSALGKVNMQGQITDTNGLLDSEFDGQVHVTVFEKQSIRSTRADNTPEREGVKPGIGSAPVPVKIRENIVYNGIATVTAGQFTFDFIVPKDLDVRYDIGKISLYAYGQHSDAIGAHTNVIMGGRASAVVADKTPPTIRLYMNDESFTSGGITGQNPVFIAKLFDENGINTAGIGLGREIIAVLNEDTQTPILLNDYYTAASDNYKAGTIQYPFKNLPEGRYTLTFKVWDTHNNAAEEEISFVVSNNEKLALSHIVNRPNPFSGTTTFHFNHNRAGENLDIQIQIFTVSGKLVKTLHATSYKSSTHVSELVWDGKDEFNRTLAQGVYIYKVLVRSQQDGFVAKGVEKLVLLN